MSNRSGRSQQSPCSRVASRRSVHDVRQTAVDQRRAAPQRKANALTEMTVSIAVLNKEHSNVDLWLSTIGWYREQATDPQRKRPSGPSQAEESSATATGS